MKKVNEKEEMLPEYDFSKGIRGKHAKRYAEGSNIVMIDPDVHEFFPDQKSVNEALRSLAVIIKRKNKVEHSHRADGALHRLSSQTYRCPPLMG